MAASILAFIQFDDNTPQGQNPFTNEPSLWSLEWDYGLLGCKDYNFIAAIGGVRNQSGKEPLIPLRGCPSGDSPALRGLQDEPFVGFLTYPEILQCLEHHDLSVEGLHRSVQNIFTVLSVLSEKYGQDRVRLVFQIED